MIHKITALHHPLFNPTSTRYHFCRKRPDRTPFLKTVNPASEFKYQLSQQKTKLAIDVAYLAGGMLGIFLIRQYILQELQNDLSNMERFSSEIKHLFFKSHDIRNLVISVNEEDAYLTRGSFILLDQIHSGHLSEWFLQSEFFNTFSATITSLFFGDPHLASAIQERLSEPLHLLAATSDILNMAGTDGSPYDYLAGNFTHYLNEPTTEHLQALGQAAALSRHTGLLESFFTQLRDILLGDLRDTYNQFRTETFVGDDYKSFFNHNPYYVFSRDQYYHFPRPWGLASHRSRLRFPLSMDRDVFFRNGTMTAATSASIQQERFWSSLIDYCNTYPKTTALLIVLGLLSLTFLIKLIFDAKTYRHLKHDEPTRAPLPPLHFPKDTLFHDTPDITPLAKAFANNAPITHEKFPQLLPQASHLRLPDAVAETKVEDPPRVAAAPEAPRKRRKAKRKHQVTQSKSPDPKPTVTKDQFLSNWESQGEAYQEHRYAIRQHNAVLLLNLPYSVLDQYDHTWHKSILKALDARRYVRAEGQAGIYIVDDEVVVKTLGKLTGKDRSLVGTLSKTVMTIPDGDEGFVVLAAELRHDPSATRRYHVK